MLGAHLLGPNGEEVTNLFALAIGIGLRLAALSHTIYTHIRLAHRTSPRWSLTDY